MSSNGLKFFKEQRLLHESHSFGTSQQQTNGSRNNSREKDGALWLQLTSKTFSHCVFENMPCRRRIVNLDYLNNHLMIFAKKAKPYYCLLDPPSQHLQPYHNIHSYYCTPLKHYSQDILTSGLWTMVVFRASWMTAMKYLLS